MAFKKFIQTHKDMFFELQIGRMEIRLKLEQLVLAPRLEKAGPHRNFMSRIYPIFAKIKPIGPGDMNPIKKVVTLYSSLINLSFIRVGGETLLDFPTVATVVR